MANSEGEQIVYMDTCLGVNISSQNIEWNKKVSLNKQPVCEKKTKSFHIFIDISLNGPVIFSFAQSLLVTSVTRTSAGHSRQFLSLLYYRSSRSVGVSSRSD